LGWQDHGRGTGAGRALSGRVARARTSGGAAADATALSMRRGRLFLIAMLGALLADPRAAAANCGAEGCPLAPQGPDAAIGRSSLDFGYQYVEQDRFWDGAHSISSAEFLAAESNEAHILEQFTLTRTFLATGRVRV